jgi:hypothetical protein
MILPTAIKGPNARNDPTATNWRGPKLLSTLNLVDFEYNVLIVVGLTTVVSIGSLVMLIIIMHVSERQDG